VSNGPLMGRVDMWNHRIHLFAPVTGTNKSGSPSGGALDAAEHEMAHGIEADQCCAVALDAFRNGLPVSAQPTLCVSLYNHQLCVLRPSLWPYAQKSISDWENTYLSECETCGVLT
jgi:hypothetical protein